MRVGKKKQKYEGIPFPDGSYAISFRLKPGLMNQLDQVRARIQKFMRKSVTRTDAMRLLLALGWEAGCDMDDRELKEECQACLGNEVNAEDLARIKKGRKKPSSRV